MEREIQLEACPDCGYGGYFTYVTDLYLACPRCGIWLDEDGCIVEGDLDKDNPLSGGPRK